MTEAAAPAGARDSYRLTRTGTTAERIATYAALLSAVFPGTHRFDPSYLHWQYVENPDGEVVGFDALSGDELAAHYVTIPVSAVYKGEMIKGVLSLNTATHPNHQGKGLFTRLASQTYDLAQSLGYKFVIGVANQNSTPGFLRKLGFDLVSPLDVRFGLGAPSDSEIEPEFQRHWSAEAFAWRLSNPSTTYRVRNSRIFADSGHLGIRMLLASRPIAEARGEQDGFFATHPVTAWVGLKPAFAWEGLGFPLPGALRPSPLNFIFKSLSDLPCPSADRTLFEAIDFDAY